MSSTSWACVQMWSKADWLLTTSGEGLLQPQECRTGLFFLGDSLRGWGLVGRVGLSESSRSELEGPAGQFSPSLCGSQ